MSAAKRHHPQHTLLMMVVRNVRTRNWSTTASSTTNTNPSIAPLPHRTTTTTHSNHHHHHHHRTSSSSSRTRRQRWIIFLVISSSSLLFIIFRLIIKSDRYTGNSSHHQDRTAVLPGEGASLRSSLSLHRWYTSSMNRYRNNQNDHVPINSILFRTYQKQKQHSKSRTAKPPSPPQHRIAMLLPYTTTPSSSNHDNSYTSILSYFTLFCYSVAGTADIMDFYIFHTGILRDGQNRDDSDNGGDDEHDALRNHTTLQHCPPNVIFVNLKNHHGLAQYLLRVVDVKYQKGNHSDPTLPPPKLPVMKYSELLDLVESYVKMNPYGLVEFKPALGHVFADYIRPNIDGTAYYTHWGYTDFDIAFGDVARWLTAEELNHYDIVTYTFGDQQRLYVRGQFTIHKNRPETINQLWRQCSYLSNLDERFESIIQHSTKYHVESAEGCYSAVLLNQTNISIKFAVKAWTDIYTDDTAYTHGVAISQSPITGRQVLYKLKAGGGMNEYTPTNSSHLFYKLRSSWFENEDSVYYDRSVDLQRPVGERIRLDDPYDKDDGASKTKKKPCMYWALAKYQSKLCLKDGIVNSNDVVYFINGVLYKQQYENVPIFPNEPNIITAPLFHFQEWKRSYRFEQLAPLYSSMFPTSSSSSMFNANVDVNTFLLTPNGVIPMISSSYHSSATKKVKKKQSTSSAVSSPLSKIDMTTWSSEMHLPLSTYCIRSRLDGSKLHTKCDTAISYHDDTGRLTILSRAPQWTHVSIESDVTLVLTLQFMPSWDIETKEHLVQSVIDNVKMNIDRWYGRPCILVVSLPNRLYEKTTEYLRRQLDVETNPNFGSCFILTFSDDQVQEDNDDDAISRKALLNMAIDMVPTRWYISGIELERGLVVSTDTSYVAHRTAATYSELRGSIFIIPQFGSKHTTTGKDNDNQNADADESMLSFDEFLRLKRSGKVSWLGDEWNSDCTDHEKLLNEVTKRIDNVWMAESLLWIGSLTTDVDPIEVNAKIIRDLETFQQYMVKMAQEGMDEAYEDTAMYAYHESPILLTDNLGPHNGIRTSEIVREVEAFAGIRCYNSVRLSQMILMNYTLNVLPLAFVSKSPYATTMSNEMQKQQNVQKHCPAMCTNFLVDDEEILYEIARSEIQRAAMTGVVWAETLGIKPSLILDVE